MALAVLGALVTSGCTAQRYAIEVAVDLGGTGVDLASSCPRDFPSSCPTPAPSWGSAVQPLVTAHCAPCHSPGGAASDRPLDDYDEVYMLRTEVEDQLYNCLMPPADGGVVPPSETDRITILTWIACHAPNN